MPVKIEMDMPKSCRECRFMQKFGFCEVKQDWISTRTRTNTEVSLDCPLQEVKE